jgi:beta-phosphoglucomutase-like phosphatase (HAD superfamily)
MIEAILFDMDGVLIEAKDWHYEALNKALSKFGMAISRDAHLTTYDGLPTRTKLKMLTKAHGLPVELHEFLNKLKQQYTIELTASLCKPVFHHQFALGRLKSDGYKMGVCSNSVRNSVHTMMRLSKLEPYLDIQISNEDVSAPKPDPEMYIKGMEMLGVKPENTLILEDNDHGIQAARASGAHVMVVGTVDDVNYERITATIADINKGK